MDLAELPLLLALVGLAAYVVLGGADFGAGLWYVLLPGERRRPLRDHTYHAMGPVWEANHVWLIFVLVVVWTAYPTAFGAIFSTLYVPLFAAALGIIIRGACYALRTAVSTPREERILGVLFGASSVLTPFALGAAIGGIASGRVPLGNAAGDPVDAWLNPTSITVGVIAVATSAYLAAVWLTGDAERAGLHDLAEPFRVRALITAAVAGAAALGGLLVLRGDAERIYDGLTSGPGLAALLASVVAGAATVLLVARRRPEPARWSAAVAVAAIVAGWALAQRPELLPGLTVEEAAAGEATIVALLISLAVGIAILIPSLVLLFSLVLRGRFDKPVQPAKIETPAPRERRSALGIAGAVCAALGAPLLFFSEGGATLALGVVLLLAGLAAAASYLMAQATHTDPGGR
jgi:cytochrome bd ubiquinol oxidase subunit II